MREFAYVYILANGFKKLYIGVTTNLQRRMIEHKERADLASHASRYHIDQLVYFERFTSIGAAINREKQLKGWLRMRKLELIVGMNPDWKDLSAGWGEAIRFEPSAKVGN